jgi:chromosome segregation ATPase
MAPWLVVLALVLAVAGYLAWWRPAPAPLPPVVRHADSLIAGREEVANAIARTRTTDSVRGARAQVHREKARVVTELAGHLDSAAIASAAAAQAASTAEAQAAAWREAYQARSSEVDTLRRVIAEQDTVIQEQAAQLRAREAAFQLADGRRRALESVVKELRDSLVASRQPPRRWHWLGVTCGAGGTATSVGLSCSVGPTYTP